MLKTSAYILLIVAAATIATAAAVATPWVNVEEHQADLRDDLLRAHKTAALQQKITAWERLVDAQTVARAPAVLEAYPSRPTHSPEDPDLPDEPARQPTPDKALDRLPLPRRPELLIFTDATGLVLTNAGTANAGPAVGESLQGLPLVKDTLSGMARDGIWVHQAGAAVFTVGASPIVKVDGDHEVVVGAVLVGSRIGPAHAELVASVLRPEQRLGYDVAIAYVYGDKVIATSANDAESSAFVNGLIGARAVEDFDPEPIFHSQDAPETGHRLGAVMSAYDASRDHARLGVVTVAIRPALTTDPIQLAGQAVSAELPAEVVMRIGIIFVIGVGLLIFGRILVSLEHSGPGRRMVQQLQKVEENIETAELDLKPFSGVYRDAARSFSTVLLGLRKRLERERVGTPSSSIPPGSALASDAPEARVVVPPSHRPTPTPPADQRASEFLDSEATMDIAGYEYARIVANSSDARIEALPSLPDNISRHEDDDDDDDDLDKTVEGSALLSSLTGGLPVSGAPALPPSLMSALPPDVDPASVLPRRGQTVDSTMDMPAEQVAAIMETLQVENPDNPLFKETREVPPATLESLGLASNPASAAFKPTDPDTNEPTRVVSEDLDRLDYETSAVTASARAGDERWGKTDQPLTPQSLLGALKKRAAVAPRRLPSASAGNEETMVKEVNPSLLRRSSDTSGQSLPVPAVPAEFQRLYDEFVAAKHQCGEPLDGLTLDRFIKRLERNKEKLVEQYNCKEVKFQVYIKEGKAALKATPIK